MQRTTLTAISLVACLMLSACGQGSVSKRLGMERQAPDEFQVLSRPPLHVPPEFNLRPPGELQDTGGLMVPASKRAEAAVFGDERRMEQLTGGSAETAVMPVASGEVASPTDQEFLSNAGADQANPQIRQLLRKESGDIGYEEDKSVLEKLREPNKREPMVDAAKEAERIKANQQEGKSATDGKPVTKMPKDRGILDKFDDIF